MRKRPMLLGKARKRRLPPIKLIKKRRLPTRDLACRAKRRASLAPWSSPVCRRITAENARRAQINMASHINNGGSSRKAAANTINAESDISWVSSRGFCDQHFNTKRCNEKSAKTTSTSTPSRRSTQTKNLRSQEWHRPTRQADSSSTGPPTPRQRLLEESFQTSHANPSISKKPSSWWPVESTSSVHSTI